MANHIDNLRFWCQKVLPLVYDDSLSYYELLCKVVEKLNECVDLSNKIASDWDDLKNTALKLIIEYVDEQINNGTIGTIIDEAVSKNYSELETKINNVNNSLNSFENETKDNFNDMNSRISSLATNLNILQNRKYIFIGDSWSIQYGSNSYGWMVRLGMLLNIENSDQHYYGAGGYGFVSSGGLFSTLLENAINDINTSSKRNEITDIVVLGGINDRGKSGIASAITSFCKTCKNYFPNAKVWIGCLGWGLNYAQAYTIGSTSYRDYVFGATSNFIGNSVYMKTEWLAHDYRYFQNEGFHLNDSGIDEVVINLYNILMGGNPQSRSYWVGISKYANVFTGTWINKTDAFVTSIADGWCTISQNEDIQLTGFDNLSFSNNSAINVISYNNADGCFAGNVSDNLSTAMTTVVAVSGSKYYFVPCKISLRSSGQTTAIFLTPYCESAINGISEMAIAPWSIKQPWWYC